MKLIRNQTPDGSCKYALIQLEKLPDVERKLIVTKWKDRQYLPVPTCAILIGNESPADQFFVLKYKDVFAHHALHAYAVAVRKEAEEMPEGEQRRSLLEYAAEVFEEAEIARRTGVKIPD